MRNEKQKSPSREQNRKDFPFAAARMDEARKLFGDGVKLVWAKENGKSVGNAPSRT